MNKSEILSKINENITLINDELKNGYVIHQQDSMVVEEVIKNNLPTITNTKEITNYADYHFLEKACNEITTTLEKVRKSIELEDFFSSGKSFDNKELRKQYLKKGIKKKFPKFNLDKYLDLLETPPLEFTNFGGELVKYDPYWVKKNLIAFNQMIFNEMDLYILNIGKEGSGKSCWSSQQLLYFYNFLIIVGLIDYAYDIKKMFFTDILTFLEEHERQHAKDYFRIEVLDEGNELNRANFRDETNQQFKYEMRTERKMLRIILINMQQLGELDTSISLSRVNFIYDCQMRSNKKSGTLDKGFIEMYIIPRDNTIYSAINKKNLTRGDILNTFANKLDKKKDYYVSLPKDMIVNKFRFTDVWGFDKENYDSHVKDEMRKRKFLKSMKMTNLQAYILMTKCPNFTKLGTFNMQDSNDKKKYDVLHKFFKKIDSYFELNPEKRMSIENFYDKPKNI